MVVSELSEDSGSKSFEFAFWFEFVFEPDKRVLEEEEEELYTSNGSRSESVMSASKRFKKKSLSYRIVSWPRNQVVGSLSNRHLVAASAKTEVACWIFIRFFVVASTSTLVVNVGENCVEGRRDGMKTEGEGGGGRDIRVWHCCGAEKRNSACGGRDQFGCQRC